MHWTDAIDAGITDKVLVKWAQEMWTHIWIRQSHVNYIGMWKKRFEKEDKKVETAKEQADAKVEVERLVMAASEKIMGRLLSLNLALGTMDSDISVA